MRIKILLLAALLAGAARAARAADAASDYAPLDFHVLGDYAIELPDSAFVEKLNIHLLRPIIKAKIPQAVKELDGHKVAISGFMLPLDDENGGTRKFILMRNQITCCFGGANRLNEYVVVTMNGPKPVPYDASPVTVRGTLTVGPEFEDGALNGIYQMAGDEVHK